MGLLFSELEVCNAEKTKAISVIGELDLVIIYVLSQTGKSFKLLIRFWVYSFGLARVLVSHLQNIGLVYLYTVHYILLWLFQWPWLLKKWYITGFCCS
ncbi:hypothetical protein BKA67DRAFT_391449 [Truncatella angustata]|uniref:Uncharacterized protein n=1 Tax=Truncatella angustata TaxID=152316 RepID=A0A9P8RKL9_9PEZI|nr:uncharacterized protein BKA67DRAFT_391449 [Truncatella angustata]KAH6647566.1 hypothetical protein BKA67DRAFT_391449 [Truncatella angustata]